MGMMTESKQITVFETRTGVRTIRDETGETHEERFTETVPVTRTELITRWVQDHFDSDFTYEADSTFTTAALPSETELFAPTDAEAAAAIAAKIDPARGNMDPELARLLSRMYSSPVYRGATPEGSPNGPVWFQNFYLDENADPNLPDAQVYAYVRDGELVTFEVAGSFARAYATIDPGRAGSNSALGLPTSGREVVTPDHPFFAQLSKHYDPSRPMYFQNFENGVLVQTDPGGPNSPAKFTWLDNQGNVVKENFEVPSIDLSAANSIQRGIVRPLDAPLTRVSEFGIVDPEGAPANNGVAYHAGKDWFAPAGSTVRSPIDGTIVGIYPSRGNSGQVFGGTVMVQGEDGKVWVFRHVDPANLTVGQTVRAGDPIATVTDWKDGPDHAHIELWKTLEGGYDFENMIDPMLYLEQFVG